MSGFRDVLVCLVFSIQGSRTKMNGKRRQIKLLELRVSKRKDVISFVLVRVLYSLRIFAIWFHQAGVG